MLESQPQQGRVSGPPPRGMQIFRDPKRLILKARQIRKLESNCRMRRPSLEIIVEFQGILDVKCATNQECSQ